MSEHFDRSYSKEHAVMQVVIGAGVFVAAFLGMFVARPVAPEAPLVCAGVCGFAAGLLIYGLIRLWYLRECVETPPAFAMRRKAWIDRVTQRSRSKRATPVGDPAS